MDQPRLSSRRGRRSMGCSARAAPRARRTRSRAAARAPRGAYPSAGGATRRESRRRASERASDEQGRPSTHINRSDLPPSRHSKTRACSRDASLPERLSAAPERPPARARGRGCCVVAPGARDRGICSSRPHLLRRSRARRRPSARGTRARSPRPPGARAAARARPTAPRWTAKREISRARCSFHRPRRRKRSREITRTLSTTHRAGAKN